MTPSLLTIAVSSRALFNFEEENKVFDREGEAAYMRTQEEKLNTRRVAEKGIAFPMVKKLLSFNTDEQRLVDIIVLSRNDPVTGLRVFHSTREYGLDIRCGCFTRGSASLPYLSSFEAHLFLSAFDDDVHDALKNGFPAARVMGRADDEAEAEADVLKIAFDGDAVLFDDDAERVYQEHGLEEFQKQEEELANHPLPAGPIQPFLQALQNLQKKLCPPKKIRTALITARGAPAHERPIRTLMEWGISVDEAFFLNGSGKQSVLDAFRPDFFFDDQKIHLNHKQPGGHVKYGVTNERG